jgi:hypothetical protein
MFKSGMLNVLGLYSVCMIVSVLDSGLQRECVVLADGLFDPFKNQYL